MQEESQDNYFALFVQKPAHYSETILVVKVTVTMAINNNVNPQLVFAYKHQNQEIQIYQ